MKKFSTLFLLFLFLTLGAKEYFVATDGKDTNPGTAERPFATFAKALSVMQGGDSMNIFPGVYHQAIEAALIRTSPTKQTAIRAVYPGTVLLRGDVDAPEFTKVPGRAFTYVCDWSGPVETVYERNSLMAYQLRNNYTGLDFERGVWYYDKKKKKLYVVTGNGASPEEHYLTISTINKIGITVGQYKQEPRTCNLLIEGLAVTGFYFSGDTNKRPTANEGICGRYLKDSLIRNCDTFLCGGGIRLWKPVSTVVENCRAYGNGAMYAGSGGNIIINGPTENCAIRDCLVFNSCKAGIRFYGGTIKNCVIEKCVSGGGHEFGDIWCKGASDGKSFIRNCFAAGNIYPSSTLPNMPSTESNNVYYYTSYSKNKNSIMTWRSTYDHNRTFADPENWDYRLQKNAKVTGGLVDRKNVYFLSPSGKDTNDGRSIDTPWRTLQKIEPGSTVYLEPGTYAPFKIAVPGVTIAGRGSRKNIIVKGGSTGIIISAPGVTLERINFLSQSKNSLLLESGNAKISNCGFDGAPAAIAGKNLKSITISNCAFTGVPYDFVNVQANIHSNIMAKEGKSDSKSRLFFNANAFPVKNAQPYSLVIRPEYRNVKKGDFTLKNAKLFNGRGMLGYPVGPYRRILYREKNIPAGLRAHAVGSTVANIEFFNGINKVENRLLMGESPDKLQLVIPRWQDPDSPFRTYTFNGLKPGKKYYVRIDSIMPKRLLLSNEEISAAAERFYKGNTRGPVLEFTTLPKDPAPREYHVSVRGDDLNPGTAAKPFRTISKAAELLRAGDTVTIHGGTYSEAVHLRSGGAPGLPVTFRAAPGEKVFLEGANQKLSFAFRSQNKSHIRFDGFRCRLFNGTGRGVIQLSNGKDHRITRTIFDGRAPNYTNGSVQAENITDLLIENCVTLRGFQGMWLQKCDNAVLRNNLFHVNQLTPLAMNYQPMKVTITHNIFFDTVMQKQRNPLLALPFPEMLTVENNCFYLRVPPAERLMCGALLASGKGRMTFTQFRKFKGGRETNIFVNPQLKSTPQLTTFKSLAERDRLYPACAADEDKKELGMTAPGIFKAWDWKDYFPLHPLCTKKTAGRPMGPDPAAFKGFL